MIRARISKLTFRGRTLLNCYLTGKVISMTISKTNQPTTTICRNLKPSFKILNGRKESQKEEEPFSSLSSNGSTMSTIFQWGLFTRIGNISQDTSKSSEASFPKWRFGKSPNILLQLKLPAAVSYQTKTSWTSSWRSSLTKQISINHLTSWRSSNCAEISLSLYRT